MERKLLALLANLPDSGISLFSKRNMNGTSHNRYDCLKPTERRVSRSGACHRLRETVVALELEYDPTRLWHA